MVFSLQILVRKCTFSAETGLQNSENKNSGILWKVVLNPFANKHFVKQGFMHMHLGTKRNNKKTSIILVFWGSQGTFWNSPENHRPSKSVPICKGGRKWPLSEKLGGPSNPKRCLKYSLFGQNRADFKKKNFKNRGQRVASSFAKLKT